MADGRVIRNFSRWAHLYDEYSGVQRAAADELARGLDRAGVAEILEIGCGTGNYTRLLADAFKSARITAFDISPRMIEVARRKLKNDRVIFAVADAEIAKFETRFDLITSNAAFQWVADLGPALSRCRDACLKNGSIAFSIFGPLTFQELKVSLTEALGKAKPIRSDSFLDKENVMEILKRHFANVSVAERVIRKEYGSLMELLNTVRYTGSGAREGDNSLLWRRQTLKNTEEIYRKRFGRIEASYQIFFCRGRR